MTKRKIFTAKAFRQTFALTLTLCLILSMVPAMTFGAPNYNISIFETQVYQTHTSVTVAEYLDPNEDGAEFELVVVLEPGWGEPLGNLFVATNRPSVDRVYYKINNNWYQVPSSGILLDNAEYVSDRTRVLKLKVVSATAGLSRIAFGADQADVAAYASNPSNYSDFIIQQTYYEVDFTSAAGSIDIYRSDVAEPRSPAYTVDTANPDSTGAEFTVTVVSNNGAPSGRLYAASSRPTFDTIYYRLNNRWNPVGSSGVNLADCTYLTPTSGELIFKVVSTAPGKSDIAFGLESNSNTINFAQGRAGADDRKIIRSRLFSADFTSAYGGLNVSSSTVAAPNTSVFAASAASPTAEGAEFTLRLFASSGNFPANIFIATNRYQTDTVYYKTGNTWIEIGRMTNATNALAIPIEPITRGGYLNGGTGTTTIVNSTTRELLVKVVSTAVGTSQVAFGLDAVNTMDYAMDYRGADQTRIIQQKRFAAEFISVTDPNAQRYTIMYNANGGTQAPADQIKTRNEPLTLSISQPIRAGYTFLGWSTVNSATTAIYPPGGLYTIDANTTLYAVWSNSSDYYTVTVSENEVLYGHGNAAPPSALPGTAVLLSTVAYNGYTFDHWESLTNNVTITNPYSPTASFTMPANHVSVRAVFKVATSTGSITDFRFMHRSVGVQLSWSATGSSVGYRVYRSENANSEGAALNSALITGNEFLDANARSNTIYYYTVRQVIREGKPNEGIPEELGPASTKLQVLTSTIESPPIPQGSAVKNFILMKIDDGYMSVGGARQEVDPGRGTGPMLLNNRTMVPARAIAEAMGGSAGWQEANREVSLNVKSYFVLMWLDNPVIAANGTSKVLDVAPASINGRTMVPLRGALENLNCVVEWLPDTSQVAIIFYE
ncbi:MAG: stalk domain-containing protein [Clostridiales bacterium]|nr:stalk domain-containing protein [Clostridiales bacterium]